MKRLQIALKVKKQVKANSKTLFPLRITIKTAVLADFPLHLIAQLRLLSEILYKLKSLHRRISEKSLILVGK